MWTDPIVEEVRAAREEYAASFNHDLDAIVRDLQKRQAELEEEGWIVVKPPNGVKDIAKAA